MRRRDRGEYDGKVIGESSDGCLVDECCMRVYYAVKRLANVWKCGNGDARLT